MKYKFIPLDITLEEVERLHNYLEDILCWPKLIFVVMIYYDNQSTIGKTQSSIYNVSQEIFVKDTIPLGS